MRPETYYTPEINVNSPSDRDLMTRYRMTLEAIITASDAGVTGSSLSKIAKKGLEL